MNIIKEKLLQYINYELILSEYFAKHYSNRRLLTFGEPILPEEMKYINKILNRFPDAVISIPVDDPFITLKEFVLRDRANLLDCTDWSPEMREKLKPAILDIFALQKVWTKPWVKREAWEEMRKAEFQITSWLDSQSLSGEYKRIYIAIKMASSIESLKMIKEELEKIA